MRTLLLTCLLFLSAQGVEARRLRPAAPVPVRLVVFVGEKLEGIRPDFDWEVQYRGKRYRLYVLNLTVLNGSVTPLGIDAAVAPYRVKFMLAGDPAALQRFTTTPPRQQIVITGYMRLDASGRYLMLSSVDSGPPPSPTTSQ